MKIQLFNTEYINWFYLKTVHYPRFFPTRIDENGTNLWARCYLSEVSYV